MKKKRYEGDSVLGACDFYYDHINIDKQFLSGVQNLTLAWVSKNPMYSEFLGSGLLGVHPIRFSSRDRELALNSWGVEVAEITSIIHGLSGVNPEWNVSSDPLSISIFYLIRKTILTVSKTKLRDAIVLELYKLYMYYVTSGLTYRYFKKYQASPAVAKATFERLSGKFTLKRVGSWAKFFEYRVSDVTPEKGLHVDRLRRFEDLDVIRVLNDSQGRVREVFKSIYPVMLDVVESGVKITAESGVVESGDSSSVREILDRPDKHATYLTTILKSEVDFINEDLVHIITGVVGQVDRANLITTLKHLSAKSKDNYIGNSVVVNSIGYLNSRSDLDMSNVMTQLKYLKNYWVSSTVRNSGNDKVKRSISNMVRRSTTRKTKWVVSVTTVAVILYIYLRATVGRLN